MESVQRKAEFFKPGALIAVAQAAAGREQGLARQPPLRNDLGTLTVPVTTRAPEAQRTSTRACAGPTPSTTPRRSARSGRRRRPIPTCAMCYWGEAWVLGPNINEPMKPEATRRHSPRSPGDGAARRRQPERAGADRGARGALLAGPEGRPQGARAAYADAMGKVRRAFPDDDQIQVLYAEALMNLQPWDYWEAGRPDAQGPHRRERRRRWRRCSQRNPEHPGAIHLYIHAVEASTTPERAEPYADRLAR